MGRRHLQIHKRQQTFTALAPGLGTTNIGTICAPTDPNIVCLGDQHLSTSVGADQLLPDRSSGSEGTWTELSNTLPANSGPAPIKARMDGQTGHDLRRLLGAQADGLEPRWRRHSRQHLQTTDGGKTFKEADEGPAGEGRPAGGLTIARSEEDRDGAHRGGMHQPAEGRAGVPRHVEDRRRKCLSVGSSGETWTFANRYNRRRSATTMSRSARSAAKGAPPLQHQLQSHHGRRQDVRRDGTRGSGGGSGSGLWRHLDLRHRGGSMRTAGAIGDPHNKSGSGSAATAAPR